MLSGTLCASLLGIYDQVKEQLEQMKIFNSAPSFN